MRFLFLNQYFPPDPAPTGMLLAELADRLRADGHAVDFVAARQEYRGGQRKGGRMAREAVALVRMLAEAVRRPRADVVISASSPPCLLVVATLAAMRHRARSAHWAMDLYPELAVALREVPAGAVSRAISALMGWCYRRTDRVVALDADMAEALRRYGIEPAIVRPWVFSQVQAQADRAGEDASFQEPWTWIYSGNLGRAHEWETLLEAQAIIEARDPAVRLVFQGGGPSLPAAQEHARKLGLRRCEWRGYMDEAELPSSLLRCGACVVTQKPEARGLLWPSKLALLLGLPRPIVWVGPVDGAVADCLRKFPHTGIFTPGQAGEIAEWILQWRGRSLPVRPALSTAEHSSESLEQWMAIIRDLAESPGR